MASAQLDIIIEQGAEFKLRFSALNDDMTPMNLSAYTSVLMSIAPVNDLQNSTHFSGTFVNQALGDILVLIAGIDTMEIPYPPALTNVFKKSESIFYHIDADDMRILSGYATVIRGIPA